MGWRHWNTALHRDAGYVVAALTVVYAVSGVAVNHTADWNPNYQLAREERRFEPVPVGERDAMVAELVRKLDLPGPPRDAFRSRPDEVELFYDGWSVKADATAGVATVERPRDRFLLRDFNFLHLNHAKGGWTYVADLYALALCFMAVSGVLIPRGKQSLAGRGKWWVMAGIAVPAAFVIALRHW
jgi:hypothetical protein